MIKKFFSLFWKGVVFFFMASIIGVIVFKWMPVSITPTMIYNLPKQAWDSKRKFRLEKDWESIDHISENVQLAVVCAEDQNFLEHSGFDLKAIKKAMKSNQKGKKIKGGSTISQQTAKNLFLLPHRNYIRKAFEVYFTFLIECCWSKERIMEVYLNIIEFGDGVYGVQAASQHFFHKDAHQLTNSQAALLAAVLPNPLKYQVDHPSPYVLKRKRWISRQMSHWGNNLEFEHNAFSNEDENEPKEE